MAEKSLKCANPSCAGAARCRGTGEFFRLEILNPRDAAAADMLSACNGGSIPRLRVEEYWLCANCAGTYTLTYDPEASTVVGVKRPPRSPDRELEFESADKLLPIF